MSTDATHVTIDDIADAAENLLPADRAATVEAHLDGCADCRELSAALVDTCSALAADPAPTMPDDVFERLQAVVSAEAERRASGEASDEDELDRAAAVKRTALGTFGQNPGYAKKAIGHTELTCSE